MTTSHRIAIVEDDPLIRDHYLDIVTRAPDLDIAGIAATLASARSLIALKPDLFLLDLGLPDGSSLDLIPDIKQGCQARILVVTAFGDPPTVVRAMRAGADGYLLKDDDADTVIDGIRVTIGGGAPINPLAAAYLLEHLRGGGPPVPDAGDAAQLTPREAELLKLFVRGATYKQAARQLDISPLTVGSHVKSIYMKLAVHSRGEAVYEAVRTGQVRLD